MSCTTALRTELLSTDIDAILMCVCIQWAFGWAPRFGLWEWEVTEANQVLSIGLNMLPQLINPADQHLLPEEIPRRRLHYAFAS